MSQMSPREQDITLYYDGDCLICQQFSRYIALKKKYNVHIRNAREYPDQIHSLMHQGYNINQGMILISPHGTFVGEDAAQHLECLIDQKTRLDRFALRVSHISWLSKLLYKCGKLIRKIVFLCQGKWEKVTFK